MMGNKQQQEAPVQITPFGGNQVAGLSPFIPSPNLQQRRFQGMY
jgi:hypothetical protein